MQGHIYQALALTVVGNEYLRGLPVHPFWPDGDAFKFERDIKFIDGLSRPFQDHELIAPDPLAWLAWLKTSKVHAVRMHHIAGPSASDEYSTVALGDCRRWLIETAATAHSDFWRATQTVHDRGAHEDRIWSSTYTRLTEKEPPLSAAKINLDGSRAELEDVLFDLVEFTTEHSEISHFNVCFARALEALGSDVPFERDKRSDFNNSSSLTLKAKQLLEAAINAWVFGGMGSWNESGVTDRASKAIELALSERLWIALTNAVVAAVNSSVDPEISRK